MVFKLNRASLDFLLRQVQIGIDYTQLADALDPSGLREVRGTNNNLVGSDSDPNTPGIQLNPASPGPYAGYGAADTPFLRMSQVSYELGAGRRRRLWHGRR